MTYQPFLIAPLDSGLDKKFDAWLSADDAVIDGNNFIIRSGRIEKRRGYEPFNDFGNGESVVGIMQYIDRLNGKELVVIQEGSIWKYVSATNTFTAITGATLSGGDYNYYNSAIFPVDPNNRLYFLNGSAPLQYYDGTNVTVPTITVNGLGDVVTTASWVFFYNERLVLLDVTETAGRFGQRVRWSAVEDPSKWRDDIQGEGGFLDAPTGDFIQGAAFLRDTLMVFFEDSIWALRGNPDPLLPFVWDKVNDTRECQAPYSVVGYDRFTAAIGKTGIVATDGVSAQLIDDKIPFFVANEMRISLLSQIFGFRYRREEETWWTYPSSGADDNDSILFLSNEFQAWGKGDLSLTTLGEYESVLDPAWEDYDGSNLPEYAWDDFADETWQSPTTEDGTRLILGGTVDGNLLLLDQSANDDGGTINFEIVTKEFNPFMVSGAKAYIGYIDVLVDTDPSTTLEVDFMVDSNDTAALSTRMDFLPNWVQTAAINSVSLTNPCNVEVLDHGLSTGDNIYIYDVKGTRQLNNGYYTVTVVDDDNFTLDDVDATGYTAYTSGGIISDNAINNEKAWKRVFAGVSGNFHQIKLSHTEANQPVTIHGLVIWMKAIKGAVL